MPKRDSESGPSEQKLNEVRAERDTLTQQVAQLSQALDTATAHEVLAHRENRALRMRVEDLTARIDSAMAVGDAADAEAGVAAGNGG